MKRSPEFYTLTSILLPFHPNYVGQEDIDRFYDLNVNVNNRDDLPRLFDSEIKPRFLHSSIKSQNEQIIALERSLRDPSETFDEVIEELGNCFEDEDEINDKRQFMEVLLNCLKRYQQESN